MASITHAGAALLGPPAKTAAPRKFRAWEKATRRVAPILGIAAIAAVGWRLVRSQSTPAVHYQSALVDRGPLSAKVTASGAVSAIVTVQVGSQVSGRILAWYADFSAPVKKGQLIAQIDPSLFTAAVEQARANYAVAKASFAKAIANGALAGLTYARESALFSRTWLARADLDAAEAAAGAARADIEAAARIHAAGARRTRSGASSICRTRASSRPSTAPSFRATSM